MAVETTFVCAMHCDGTPHDRSTNRDCFVFEAAGKRKEHRFPELVGPRSRARLVVLAVEVGGRWFAETRLFLPQVAEAKFCQETPLFQKCAEQVWPLRWGGILACATTMAVATSLL